MSTSSRAIRTGSGIHAVRRTSFAGNQPLKAESKGKKRVYVVAALALGLLLVLVQNQAAVSGFLNRPVTKVRIENQWQRVSEAEVSVLLSAFMGQGFFNFDVVGVKHELEQHPWVLKASVKRVWPNTLSLQLLEQVAIARWGEHRLLNQYGELFQPDDMYKLNSLPLLTGPENNQQIVMEQYQKLNQILFPAGLRLSGLSLSKRGSWEYLLNDTMQVAAGRKDVLDKTQRFVDFYKSQALEKSSQFLSVDLRYGNGIAVKSSESEFTGVAIR
jgi:cell division protein FtsQ